VDVTRYLAWRDGPCSWSAVPGLTGLARVGASGGEGRRSEWDDFPTENPRSISNPMLFTPSEAVVFRILRGPESHPLADFESDALFAVRGIGFQNPSQSMMLSIRGF
jgi:hypothetical protein